MKIWLRLLILVFGFLVAASAKSIAAPPETVSVGKFHLEWTGVIRDSNQGKSIHGDDADERARRAVV